VHLAGFAPALASLIFNSLCRSTTANAPANETCRATVPPNAHSLGRQTAQKHQRMFLF